MRGSSEPGVQSIKLTMPTLDRLRRRLRLLVRGERGMALPTALFATIASLGLASAAVMASVDVQHGTKRDGASKSAIAAADAGANVAMLRLARFQGGLSVERPCIGPSGEEQSEATPGWCPETLPESVGSASFSYQFSAVGSDKCGDYDLCVVATGSAGEVTRRIQVTFDDSGQSGTGEGEGEGGEGEEGGRGSGGHTEGLIGQDWINLSGNADIRVGVGTNGDLTTSGNASICGDIRVGVGKRWSRSGNTSQCSGYDFTAGNQTLPPVSSFMPSNIAGSNSNYRLVKCDSPDNPVGCELDTYAGGRRTATTPWNPGTRTISAAGNTTLTVGGGDYWICGIQLSGNSELIMAEGARVRFFFDTPENCGTTTQINLSGNNRIAATGYQPSEGQFDIPGFFLLGSPTTPSSVNLSGNFSTTNEYVVYGPNTNINISGNATHKGLIAGKTIAISGNGVLLQDSGFELPPDLDPWSGGGGEEGGGEEGGSGFVHYTPQHYVECSGVSVSLPNDGC